MSDDLSPDLIAEIIAADIFSRWVRGEYPKDEDDRPAPADLVPVVADGEGEIEEGWDLWHTVTTTEDEDQ